MKKLGLGEKVFQRGKVRMAMVLCCFSEISQSCFNFRLQQRSWQTTFCYRLTAVKKIRHETDMPLGSLFLNAFTAPCNKQVWAVRNAMLFGMTVMKKALSLS